MKIRLTRTLPVAPEHGCREGRVFEVLKEENTHPSFIRWWIKGDSGEEVGVLSREAVVVEEN